MPALPAIALATAVIGTGYSIYSGERANSQAKKAASFERQQVDLQGARQKRDVIRQARVAYAQSQATAENQGVSGSSSAQGGGDSIVSQMSDSLSFLDQYGFMSDQASKHLGKAQTYRQNAETGSQISGLGMAAYANAPEIQNSFNKMFKPK
jgi:hypothetical protein